MRKILPLIFIASIFIFSCGKKTRNVHFYGRAWVECDGTPIVNGTVTIRINYDPGTSQSDEVATTSTDGNGDYSIITDVKYDGSFETYTVALTSDKYNAFAVPVSGNSGSSKDVHCDLPATESSKANLHFKNTQPVDSNDELLRFYISTDSTQLNNYIEMDLQGTDVDTIIPLSFPVGRRYYKCSYRKNGVSSFTPLSFFDLECRTDVNVDINY